MKKYHVVLLHVLVCLAAGGFGYCRAAAPSDAPPRPVWIASPKSDDSIFMYRVGMAEDAASEVRARQAAFEDALRVIQDEMLARAGVADADRADWRALFVVKDAAPIPGAAHVEQTAGGFLAWVMVSCPLAERDRLLREISDARNKLRLFLDRMRGARAAMLRGEYDAALPLLREMESGCAEFPAPGFALEEARLMLGDAMRALNDAPSARAYYETVAGMSSSAAWAAQARERLDSLPAPPRLWPMRALWGGRVAAQLCVLGADVRPPELFGALAAVLRRDFKESQMSLVDISGVTPVEAARVFDTLDMRAIADATRAVDAEIALIISIHTDTTRQGQTQTVMGMNMPMPDTVIRFMVMDAVVGAVVYADEFREMRGRQSDTRLAERVAAILINNYLVKKCPAIRRAGRDAASHIDGND